MTTIKNIQDVEMESNLKELKEWKVLKQQAEDRIKELENSVRDFMTKINETNISVGPYTCKISEVEKSTFDKGVVMEKAPDVYADACGTKTYTRLIIK